MKKIFAVLILFTILVSGVFAELSIGGSVGGAATLLKGTNVNGDVLQAGWYLSGNITATGVNEATTFGGEVQINAEAHSVDQNAWAWSASVWWKPLSFMRLQLGVIDAFALTDIVGSGYHANDAEPFVIHPQDNYVGDYFSQTTGFYSGTGRGWTGLTLSATPIYGLDINLAIPFGRFVEQRDINGLWIVKYNAVEAYTYTSAQISYTLFGLGRLAFSFAGNGDGTLALDPETNAPGSAIRFQNMLVKAASFYASFLLTAFEDSGFGLNIGAAYSLPAEDKTNNVTYYSPLEVGLGLSFAASQWGIKTRMAASFLGSAARPGIDPIKDPLIVGLGILPNINFGPLTVYFNTGISYKTEVNHMFTNEGQISAVANSASLGWHVNPYIMLASGGGDTSFGTFRFYAGGYLATDGLKYVGTNKVLIDQVDLSGAYPGQAIMDWGVSIGLLFDF